MTQRLAYSTLLLVFVSLSAIAQSSMARVNYSIPRPFSLERLVRQTFPKYYGREEYNRLYVDGFYPIGWSREGKFAYYVEPLDETCGCYFAELVIRDLRTDKILWHFKNDPNMRVDKEGTPLLDDIRKLWKRNQKVFSEKLREYGIVPTSRFVLLPKTFRSGGKSYAATISSLLGDDPDGLSRIRKVALDISSSSLGTKTLYSTEYKGDDMYASPLDVAIAGAFKSPFENRVAIVMLNVQRGWEGPPNTVDIDIIGADLASGFRKSK